MAWRVAHEAAEVVSGSLPNDRRGTFCSRLEKMSKQGIQHLVVEGARTVARDASAAQDFFQVSKEASVTITPVDVPSLYEHDADNDIPAQRFLRHALFAYVQLERDMVVHGLQDGLARKRDKARKDARVGNAVAQKNQKGGIKINGRRSIEQRPANPPKSRSNFTKSTTLPARFRGFMVSVVQSPMPQTPNSRSVLLNPKP